MQKTLLSFLLVQNIILLNHKIMSEKKTIVNSWNEWDPLKHVIVGKADGTCIPAPEPALMLKFQKILICVVSLDQELKIQLIKQINF